MVKILSCYRLNIFTSPGDKYYIMLKGIIIVCNGKGKYLLFT